MYNSAKQRRDAMATTEHTINDMIAELLKKTRFAWRGDGVVLSESTGQLAESKMLQPDILIKEPWTPPVVIETELMPAQGLEADALARLGKEAVFLGAEVNSVIALRLPQRLKESSGRQLKRELRKTQDFQFALYFGNSAEKYDRYPESGWLTGGLHNLSLLAQSATVPPSFVDQAATWLEMGINQAATYLQEIAGKYPQAVQNIAAELHQQDSTQTRRMAMAILINAFIFHEHLAGGPGELGKVRNLDLMEFADFEQPGLKIPDILTEWNKILSVNYWPIFDIARRILIAIPNYQSQAFLSQLARTAGSLLANNLMRSHDLTGTVFQRLIADRKFLAAFYTKPASAALLVALAINEDTLLRDGDWSSPEAVASLRIGDFACGTGTLLSTVYQRVSQLHELHGGNTEAIHARMMARTLVGCDILPAAAHLTAAALAGAYPQAQYDESAVFTAPYGIQPDGEVKLGSIDLLRHGELLQGLEITAKAIEATQGTDVDIWRYAPHGSFDMVIMNPPFTRPTNHEGRHKDVPNPMFAAFGSSASEQKLMAENSKKLTQGTIAHGNAGQASIFLALADRKLKKDGVLALVMPLTLITGHSWEKCRKQLREAYDDLIIVTISGRDNVVSFSADTGMGECLVIGRKSGRGSCRAAFVVLNESPKATLMGLQVAHQIRQFMRKKNMRRLEDPPNGGEAIYFGNEIIGQAIDAPLPSSGSWNLARISDLSLARTAFHLAQKHQIWLPTQQHPLAIAMSTVSQVGNIGPIGRDINGMNADGSIRGPFELRELQSNLVPTFPILWAHEAKRERTLAFEADYEGVPRRVSSQSVQSTIYEKVYRVLDTASHCHHNVDFQFDAQSTAMQFTERKTIGGRAWIAIQLPNPEQEKALVLWANSLLGLLMYWWHSSRQQRRRGSIPKSTLQHLSILDVTNLSDQQLARAAALFDELKHLPLKPLHELDTDENRKTLDRRFYCDVLGLPDSILGPLDILRRKLSQEPSIRGRKR